MDYCKKCKNFGCNAAGTERTTTICEDYMSHLPSNADRIRSMTDEELAKTMSRIEHFVLATGVAWSPEQWLDWLEQEAAE